MAVYRALAACALSGSRRTTREFARYLVPAVQPAQRRFQDSGGSRHAPDRVPAPPRIFPARPARYRFSQLNAVVVQADRLHRRFPPSCAAVTVAPCATRWSWLPQDGRLPAALLARLYSMARLSGSSRRASRRCSTAARGLPLRRYCAPSRSCAAPFFGSSCTARLERPQRARLILQQSAHEAQLPTTPARNPDADAPLFPDRRGRVDFVSAPAGSGAQKMLARAAGGESRLDFDSAVQSLKGHAPSPACARIVDRFTCVGHLRGEGKGFLESLAGRTRFEEAAQHHPQAVVRLRRIWPQLDRLAQLLDRLQRISSSASAVPSTRRASALRGPPDGAQHLHSLLHGSPLASNARARFPRRPALRRQLRQPRQQREHQMHLPDPARMGTLAVSHEPRVLECGIPIAQARVNLHEQIVDLQSRMKPPGLARSTPSRRPCERLRNGPCGRSGGRVQKRRAFWVQVATRGPNASLLSARRSSFSSKRRNCSRGKHPQTVPRLTARPLVGCPAR